MKGNLLSYSLLNLQFICWSSSTSILDDSQSNIASNCNRAEVFRAKLLQLLKSDGEVREELGVVLRVDICQGDARFRSLFY